MNKPSKIGTVLIAAALLLAFTGCSSSMTTFDTPQQPAASVPAESSAEPAPSTEESSQEESSEAEESEEESSEAEASEESSEAEASEESSEAEASEESSEAESSSEVSVEVNVADYIYFDNSSTKWEKVCAYWWNDNFTDVTNKITGELYPANGENGTQDLAKARPGIELEKIEGTEVYRCVVPIGATKIVFNSGVADEDIKNGTEAYQTDDMDFSDSDNAGQVYTIDVSVEPVAGRGKEKTKFKYGAGTWSAYNG